MNDTQNRIFYHFGGFLEKSSQFIELAFSSDNYCPPKLTRNPLVLAENDTLGAQPSRSDEHFGGRIEKPNTVKYPKVHTITICYSTLAEIPSRSANTLLSSYTSLIPPLPSHSIQ